MGEGRARFARGQEGERAEHKPRSRIHVACVPPVHPPAPAGRRAGRRRPWSIADLRASVPPWWWCPVPSVPSVPCPPPPPL